MKSIILALASAALFAGAADAADKPLVAPVPAWVKPLAIPADTGKPDEAGVRMLLLDQQIAFEPDHEAFYVDYAFKIQTPQGLGSASLSFPWRPDADELVVHKVLIRRGAQTIDVLASGQTFTVLRRETNLELAMLDGVLTANLQPEGVQVGDIIEIALTVTSRDPVLKGHVESVAADWNGLPIVRAHMRAQWPSGLAVHVRQVGYPDLKPVKNGATTSVELTRDNVRPVAAPKGAPPRYAIGPIVEMSDFGSWTALAALFAPLYEKAATITTDGKLAAEVDRIRAASQDPKVRAEAALALVQDRVRYVALVMGSGGLVPADAETTWARRFGDCKGKTAMLLGLLHALGIDAQPVVVNSGSGDGIDQRLPMVGLFDHVLVRATINGRPYWLDGTRTGDSSLDRIRVPQFYWGLPVQAGGAALVRMMPPPLDLPDVNKTIRIDASAGLSIPAPIHAETVSRGDAALGASLAFSNMTSEQRESMLRALWKAQFKDLEVKSSSTTYDPKSGEIRLIMDGVLKMDWSKNWFYTHDTNVGYEADFSRDAGPNRDAPFAVPYPVYTQTREEILLPSGFAGKKAGSAGTVDQTIAGIEFKRRYSMSGTVFTVERSTRSIAPEFPFKDAAAAQTALRTLSDDTVAIQYPSNYEQTQQELEVAAKAEGSTAEDFANRGWALMQLEKYPEAIVQFDKALALDPKNESALANRAMVYVGLENLAAARKDLDAAEALNPRNPVVVRTRGLIAQQQSDCREAIVQFGKSLEIDPGNAFALLHRAQCYFATGALEKALADLSEAKKDGRGLMAFYLMRANIFRSLGKRDEAIAETAELADTLAGDAYAQVAAARLFSALGKRQEAMGAYDRALAITRKAFIYLNRSYSRPKEDLAGRRADIEEALKLDPQNASALADKAKLQEEAGDHSGALATYAAVLAGQDADPQFWVRRGILHAKHGDTALAEKDFAAARAKISSPRQFNNACWEKATAGIALESALSDCDTALAKAPDAPAYLDSRGLVLLRLNRIDEAIADYDKALAKGYGNPSSLFGRSVAWSRKGDKAKSEADAAAAMKLDPDVRTEFEDYGVKP